MLGAGYLSAASSTRAGDVALSSPVGASSPHAHQHRMGPSQKIARRRHVLRCVVDTFGLTISATSPLSHNPLVDALLRVGNRLPMILPKQLGLPRVRYPLLEGKPRVVVQRG